MAPPNQLLQNPKLIILFLLILGFVTRFYGIWIWDLVGDENFTAIFAYDRYQALVNPAYYSLVVLFYELFGHEYWISRIPAFILSVMSIPALYLVWSRSIGKNAALFAAIILAFSAWHLWYSQFARHYMGVFLFSSLAYYYFYSALKNDSVSHLIWALSFSLVSILFHMTAVWVPASSALAYGTVLLIHRGNNSFSLRIIKSYLAVCMISALLISPILYDVLSGWAETGQKWGYGATLIVPQLMKYLQIPIVIAAFFGWVLLIRKKPLSATLFAVAIGVPIIFLVVSTPFMAISPAYAYYILPLIIILSGIACEHARELLSKSSHIFSFFPFFLLLFSLFPSFASHYLEKTTLNFNSVVRYIEENYQAGDRILTFAPGLNNKSNNFELLPFISFERDNSIDWDKELDPILQTDARTWIITSSKRKPLASKLESWLFCHSRLVWRKQAVRVDFEVSGYEIYLVTPSHDNRVQC